MKVILPSFKVLYLVLYRNSSLTSPYILAIPGCGSSVCTLDEFIRVMAPRIPDDWDSECEVGFLTTFFGNFTFIGYAALGLVVLILVALIGILVRIYINGRRRKNYEIIQDID